MKYLKIFESFSKDKLQEFCDMYLVYLKDDEFNINITKDKYSVSSVYAIDIYTITLMLLNKNGDTYHKNSFEWNKIKDHYIPFLEMLNNSYNIVSKVSFLVNYEYINHTLDEVINDKINYNNIKQIEIKVQ